MAAGGKQALSIEEHQARSPTSITRVYLSELLLLSQFRPELQARNNIRQGISTATGGIRLELYTSEDNGTEHEDS